jgi:purine-binding chemotaxis protein CheW
MSENEVDDFRNEVITQWVTFELDGEFYGINVLKIREVLRMTEITPVPGAVESALGIINLRGVVVTVIDTRVHFGLPITDCDDTTRIIIVDIDQENMVGLLVDGVSEVVNLYESKIEIAPSVGNDERSKYIYGVSQKDDYLLILIDVNKLFGVPEVDAGVMGDDDELF